MQIRGNTMWQAFRSFIAGRLVVVALLTVFAFLAITSVGEKCTTYDEIAHLTGGYSYWLHNDYRLYPENGNLPQRWATLPLLLGDYRFPSLNQPDWLRSQVFDLGHEFFYELGNDPDEMLWRSRMMIVLLGIALGWLIYEWSRRLFGREGGLVSLGIYAFSPTMLANSRLATSDIAVALMFTASLASLWMTLHHISVRRMLISGLVMGLLAVAKFSAVLIGPIAFIMVAVRLKGGRPLMITYRSRTWMIRSWGRQFSILAATLLVHVAMVVLVIWSFYGFRFSTYVHSQPGRDNTTEFGETIDSLVADSPYESAIKLMRDYHVLPETYVYALAFVLRDERATIQISFLNGRHSYRGWWQFFPYCMLVKTPLAVFVVLALAAVAAAARGFSQWRGGRYTSPAVWRRMRGVYRATPLWVFLFVYWTLALQQNINLGERHILPTYPMMYILAGAAARWLRAKHRVIGAVLLIALCELALEAFAIWPHYLAHFNQLVGGPRHGYRHLVDCSLDWGQDLPGLKRWLDQQGLSDQNTTPVYLWYFGVGSPEYYQIKSRKLHSETVTDRELGDLHKLTGGVYCISATMLQSLYGVGIGPWAVPYENEYQNLMKEVERYSNMDRNQRAAIKSEDRARWPALVVRFEQLRSARLCSFLRQREPDDHVGFSILIYRVTDEDIHRSLHGPPIELEPQIRVVR